MSAEKFRVLLVDDDEERVAAVSRAWRDRCVVLSASSIAGAQIIVDLEDIDVVVCDFNLRDEQGTTLLEYVADTAPGVFRILVSSNLDGLGWTLGQNLAQRLISKENLVEEFAHDQLAKGSEASLPLPTDSSIARIALKRAGSPPDEHD